ncbi:hypothetical protein GCM10028778_09830 [Barrientosiimonas marina]|uniref:SA1362 family protein n=1 Tax=Lentibacillus kimchii TaxID=1542911 RepID=A0ABW2UW14_9BACI
MANHKGSLVVYVIIGLAVIGVITQLFSNAASFFTTVLTMVGFGVVVSGLLYFLLFRKKQSSNDAKKYKQAVKQSKAKYSQQQQTPPATSKDSQRFGIKRKPTKQKSHLRVIDGSKSKRKNRASF